MYEGMLSLMQMAKTCGALSKLKAANVPYIAVLTDPTMAGVLASFAVVGDVTIAEPGALIGFTGPRVIKQTIKQDLPKGFQTSEFNLSHGMVDMVVPRKEMKKTITVLLDYLMPAAALKEKGRKTKSGDDSGEDLSNGKANGKSKAMAG